MTTQDIIKELAKIYLIVDDARAKLEELETDARLVIDNNYDEGFDNPHQIRSLRHQADEDILADDDQLMKSLELELEIADLAGAASQLAEDIEQTEGVEAAIAEAAGFTEIVMDPKKFHVTYTKEEAK